MISRYDIIKYFKTASQEGRTQLLTLSEDENDVIDAETHEKLCSVDEYLQHARQSMHCDFESIYYEHVSLTDVYRCRQCGTVIFGGDDEYRYDPNCRCPTCCNDDSVCRNDYWTKSQIDEDPEKQRILSSLIQMQKEMIEAELRRQARGGLYDWQRCRKVFHTKRYGFTIEHICFGYGTSSPKDRYIEVHVWNRSDGIVIKRFQIPLNWNHIYIKYIYRYTRRCPADRRKHLFSRGNT